MSRGQGWLAVLGIVGCLGAAVAAAGPVRGRNWGTWSSLTVTEGLARNWAYALAQDGSGALWASTGVLNRFDGQSFEHMPRGGALLVDRSGGVWLGTDEPALLHQAREGSGFERWGPEQGLPSARIHVLFEDRDGRIWIGTAGYEGGGRGVARFDGGSFTTFTTRDGLASDDVAAIAQDADGAMWFGHSSYSDRAQLGRGLSRYDGTGFRTYGTADGLPSVEVTALAAGPRGSLHVGTRAGLCRRLGDRFEALGAEAGIPPGLPVRSLRLDREGNLWIGSMSVWTGSRYQSRGILRHDGARTVAFDRGDLSGYDYRDILEDRDGNFWFATYAGGLLRLDPSVWRPTADVDLLHAGVAELAVDGGGVWLLRTDGRLVRGTDVGAFGTGGRFELMGHGQGLAADRVDGLARDPAGGLWIWAGGSVLRWAQERFQLEAELPGEKVLELGFGKDGRAIAATESGLWRQGTGPAERLDLAGAQVNDLLETRGGIVLLATSRGLVHLSDAGARVFGPPDGSTQAAVAAHLEEDAGGDVWFSFQRGGLFRLQGERLETLSPVEGTEAKGDPFLLDSKGRLWIGTWGRRGAQGLELRQGGARRQYERADGLGDLDIQHLAEDPRGILWIGTVGGGVSLFDGTAFQSLTTADGLASNNVRRTVFGPDGSAWILSLSGELTHYRPRRAPPLVVVAQASTDHGFPFPQSLEIPARRLQEIRFTLLGRSFNVRPDSMRYTWRLEGFDTGWSAPTSQNVAVYRDLPPGRYTFEARAVDRDLNYSRVAALVPLLVVSPWYLRPLWAVPLGLLAAAGLIALGLTVQQALKYRRAEGRLRRLLHEQESREKEALASKNAELRKAFEDLQRAQTQLVHSEKMSALGTLVAGVAHEINNPVNFIHANLPALQNYVDGFKCLVEAYEQGVERDDIEGLKAEIDYEFLLEDLDELIRACRAGTERIRQIVLDLRNFSSQDEAEMQPVDLHDGIDASLAVVSSLTMDRISLHKSYAELPKVRCNAGQINQVLLNLMKNAADAIEGQGDVWISTCCVGDFVEISVRDSGLGIPLEILGKIFDPFFTTKPVGKGRGLGLSVSSQIIELHGGKLWVESEKGEGAAFFIHLPIQGPRAR